MIAALAGLPARDAAALKIFLGMAFKGCHVVQAPATPGLALPRADVCIVDLAAMGLAQWSPKAEADLLLCLGGQHALLLGAPGNATWQDKVHATGRHGAQRLAYLAKPYGRDAMREALDSLGLGQARSPAPTPAPAAVAAPSPRDTAAPPPPTMPSVFASLQAVRTLFPIFSATPCWASSWICWPPGSRTSFASPCTRPSSCTPARAGWPTAPAPRCWPGWPSKGTPPSP